MVKMKANSQKKLIGEALTHIEVHLGLSDTVGAGTLRIRTVRLAWWLALEVKTDVERRVEVDVAAAVEVEEVGVGEQ